MARPPSRGPGQREECPACGSELAYLPLGRFCIFDGYVWAQHLYAFVTRRPIVLDRARGQRMRLQFLRERESLDR
jgi:hypothetical protein